MEKRQKVRKDKQEYLKLQRRRNTALSWSIRKIQLDPIKDNITQLQKKKMWEWVLQRNTLSVT